MFGIRVRAHGPVGGQAPPASQYAPGTDIGPALVPVPAMAASAFQSRGQIHGSAGTVAVPAPAPFPGSDQSPVAQASTGIIGMPSSQLGAWYPQVWYQTDWPGNWLVDVQKINSSHMLPARAIRPDLVQVVRGTNEPGGISPAAGAFRARYGGGWPIGWPKVSVNYPS
jgi:hypothetical protein